MTTDFAAYSTAKASHEKPRDWVMHQTGLDRLTPCGNQMRPTCISWLQKADYLNAG